MRRVMAQAFPRMFCPARRARQAIGGIALDLVLPDPQNAEPRPPLPARNRPGLIQIWQLEDVVLVHSSFLGQLNQSAPLANPATETVALITRVAHSSVRLNRLVRSSSQGVIEHLTP